MKWKRVSICQQNTKQTFWTICHCFYEQACGTYMRDDIQPHFLRDDQLYLSAACPNEWKGRGRDAPVTKPVRSGQVRSFKSVR